MTRCYPAPRFFVMPMEYAADLARSIEDAAQGEQEPEPDWYVDFEVQYRANAVRKGKQGSKAGGPVWK